MIRSALAIPRLKETQMMAEPIHETRRVGQAAATSASDGQPLWIYVPIADSASASWRLARPRYCESLRCQGKQRTATTFHAVINVPGNPDYAWVACADCTGLMKGRA
jgi:hypothetical protein